MADITDQAAVAAAASHLAQINTQQQSSSAQKQAAQQLSSQQQQQSDLNSPQPLTLRLLMQGKEVGSIIGKKGDNIKRFREVSGARINVSDSSCLERIVTLSGTCDEVYNAFSMICFKFEEQALQPNLNLASINAPDSPTSSANNNQTSNLILSNATSSVIDPLFGLSTEDILNSTLKDGGGVIKKEVDMLAMNNNDSSTINNNNLSAPNNNNNNMTNTTTTTNSSAAPTTSNNNNNTISKKNSSNSTNSNTNISVTVRLIMPASQCGSLIGKGGARIKEIREVTGATIQVAPDVLPNSTERVVTITGTGEALRNCAYQICTIMVESPPKGNNILYRPKPALNPMLLAAAASAGQAAAVYNLPGQFALSAHHDLSRLFMPSNPLAAAFNPATAAAANIRAAAAATNHAASALTAAVASQSIGSQELSIPNGLIGCIIGKGGSKINEIRQLSGATIKISNTEEGTKNRTVTINGAPDAISLAHYLITASCNGHQSLLDNSAKASIAVKSSRKFAPY